MRAKLDRLPLPPEAKKCPDISVLSPEDQDRVDELARKIGEPRKGVKPTINDKELYELEGLLADLPRIGLDDKPSGPEIEVPRALQGYWQWSQPASTWRSYDFWTLKAVQKMRFVELCRNYGWREGTSPRGTMLPLSEWEEQDRDELTALLDEAATKRTNQ
jgi:hypothetical protein